MSAPGVVKGFEQYSQSKPKYAIEQKKGLLWVKPIMDKKNVRTVFQVCMYIYIYVYHVYTVYLLCKYTKVEP